MAKSTYYKVVLLRVAFLLEIEAVANDVNKIVKRIGGWVRPAMHSKRMVAFVVLSRESDAELVERVKPLLEAITSVENYWAHLMVGGVVARHGSFDPLATYVQEAWEELGKRNNPRNVQQTERSETIIIGNMENFDRGAAIKMGIKPRRSRYPAKDPDRP